MDFWSQTAGRTSPVLEFPYSGNYSAWSPSYHHPSSSLDHLLHPNHSTPYDLYQPPSMHSSLGPNAVIYQVPEYVPLETVLSQLGVDVRSLHQTGYDRNHYISGSLPISFPIHHVPRARRRRLVCYETSDSEDDDFGYHRRHRRHSHHDYPHLPNQQNPTHLQPSNSTPNMNALWQNMLRNAPGQPPNSAVGNAWNAMANAGGSLQAPLPSGPEAEAIRNVWNQSQSATNPSTSFLSNMFNKMRQSPGTVLQPPPSAQSNQAAVHNFYALRNLPEGMNQPPQQMNPSAVNNFFAARNAANSMPPSSQSVGNVWNRAEGAIQNAPPPPGPSASSLAWNQMRQYSPPPSVGPAPNQPYPPNFQPSFGGGVRPPPPTTGAPASFAALLSQAHQQHSPYAGAA